MLGELAICVGLLCERAPSAWAQAGVTAQRESEIAPFAQLAAARPQHGQTANLGYAAGIAATPWIFHWVQPALEIRITGDSGPLAHEYTYAGGLKAATAFRNVHPYATLLKGLAAIYFTYPTSGAKGLYTHDSSRMFSVGGADLDIGRTWQMQMDYSKQYWALYAPTLRPDAFSVGLTYRIPFRQGKMK